MFHFEDTTTQVDSEEKSEDLVIVDGKTRQEIQEALKIEESEKKKTTDETSITLLDRLRKQVVAGRHLPIALGKQDVHREHRRLGAIVHHAGEHAGCRCEWSGGCLTRRRRRRD